ncbi:hypothetical protein OCU04_003921 [Sclerotinia nivalis]|uniref:DUF7770 domain-containing protein n=1 Tax=Sclerotinia nivalis TaxID=352851 RepID=A0A9X0DM93_9HELO|nr:hypothetical protein OCU04_003921 [Sclerotinia nivalis]
MSSRSDIVKPSASKPSSSSSKPSSSKPSSSRPKSSVPATRKIEPKDYDLLVDTIRVTVHTTGKFFDSDTRSGNHASIYLLASNGASVRLNMTKLTADAKRGTYQLTYCRYQHTNSSLIDFDLKATSRGLKVKHVLELIEERKRDKYKLARSGLGCRFWVQTIIKDLQEMKFISSSSEVSAADAVEGLRYSYSKGKRPELDEVDPGSFGTSWDKRSERR